VREPLTESSAVLSPCGLYRYSLTRTWNRRLKPAVWCLLNPSTADDTRNDPTVRRLIGFSAGWGYGGLILVNLFALRSTDPSALYSHPDPIGPDNGATLRNAAAINNEVIAAWGIHGNCRSRGLLVARALRAVPGCRVLCLGKTLDGSPKHPLRLRRDTPLEEYC
jgi:hypothetical protein